MSDRRSFPEAADGRPSLPMEPELWAAGLSLMDARFVARQLARQGFTLTRSDELEALRAENARYREALRNSRVAETMLIAGHLRDKAKKAEEMPAGFTIECVQPSDVAVILRCAADAIDLRARAALKTKGTRDE